MMSGSEILRDMAENAEQDPRRFVQVALAKIVERKAEGQFLRIIESCKTVACRWLRAELTERLLGSEAAKPLWDEVVTQKGCQIPDVLLHCARTLAMTGDISGAARLIRLALQNTHDYGFYVRAESIARKCREGFGLNRSVKVALLSSSTTSFLRSVLELLFLRDGVAAEFYEPPYGTYVQELLQSTSGLKRFQPDFIVLVLNWRDLGLANGTDGNVERTRSVNWIKELWRATTDLYSAKLIHWTFTTPPHDSNYALSSSLQNGRSRIVRLINEDLYSSATERLIFIDAERIAASWNGPWEDSLAWSSSKVYPAPAVLPTCGEHIASCVRAEMGLARKLLVLDADNTLWGGVLGEDGLNGIRLGPPSAVGERYQEFQQYLRELRQRGVLLAMASKNDAQEVMDALSRHASAIIRSDDFVSMKVNWRDKSTNIREIASELRLGLDSFVFLDDDPVERLAVRRELPEVIVPEVSGEPAEFIAALEHGLHFQTARLTHEDIARNASYIANATQAALADSATSLDRYLADLGMTIKNGFLNSETIARVAQLIGKTNQFNLTTPRYSQEEVRIRMESPAHWCRWYRLEDRFADHGLIGVLIVHIAGRTWTVETWLMSCRVIGREVESFMFRDLVLSARERGADRLVARYVPTAKNALVSQLLPRLGFAATEEPNEFVLNVPTAALPTCDFLRIDQDENQLRTEVKLGEERAVIND